MLSNKKKHSGIIFFFFLKKKDLHCKYGNLRPWVNLCPCFVFPFLCSELCMELPKKFCIVKAMVFPVVMYGCESWTIKKAECWRIDAFELWYWRRFLRVPWTAKRSKQSILKEISPEYSLEGLMMKLKLQYSATWCEELTHLKRPWCWEGLKAGGEGGYRGWDGWMASPTQWTWVWVRFRNWWWTRNPSMLQSMRSHRVR